MNCSSGRGGLRQALREPHHLSPVIVHLQGMLLAANPGRDGLKKRVGREAPTTLMNIKVRVPEAALLSSLPGACPLKGKQLPLPALCSPLCHGAPLPPPPRTWPQLPDLIHHFPWEFRDAVHGLRCDGSQSRLLLKRNNYTLTQRMGLSIGAAAGQLRVLGANACPGACGPASRVLQKVSPDHWAR